MRGLVIQGYFPRGVAQTKALPPHVAARLKASPSGQPLPADVRQKMEAAFGQRFHDVRVVVGHGAQSIGAIAFTQGTQIQFAHGQYSPSTPQGRKVLAHELAHVVQQRAGRVRHPYGSGTAIVHDAMLEAEAERMAMRAAMQFAPPRAPVQRKITPIQRMRAHAPRVVQMKTALQRYVPRGTVIQRLTLSAEMLAAAAAYAAQLTDLAAAYETTVPKLASALFDPAFDLQGAINSNTIGDNLKNPLTFASCYPTAEALHPLIGRAEEVSGGADTFASGADFRQAVQELVDVMDHAEGLNRNAVYRIEYAGHGFTLVGKVDPDDNQYKYELIESLAHTAAIARSLNNNLTLTPVAAKKNLRDMGDDDIDTRRAGANAMGWNADMLYLGADPKRGNAIDFPAVRMKWWVRRLHVAYQQRWMDQFKARFNTLADIMAHDHIV